jgi:uridine kinase
LLTAKMHELVREDLALREEIWSIDEARADLADRGAPEAASLVRGARGSTATIACCGETLAVGMGPLLPRASYLGAFAIMVHPSGLLLHLGDLDRYMPVKHGAHMSPATADVHSPRHAGEMVVASQRWLEGLGVTSVGSFDQHCVSGRVPELIRVAEGFHEKWIGRIADAITARKDVLKVIAIAGPSSSGKTTFIKRLTVQLLVDGIRPLALSLDDYYVDRERNVKDESGDYDFEAIEALEMDLLRDHVRRLLAGEEVKTARYDFIEGKSHPSGGRALAMQRGDVLLLEGIHGLNPILFGDVVPNERIFRVFVHPAQTLAFDRLTVLSPEDIRLLRRVVRDRRQRNHSAAETLARWPSVRRGELLHIFPFKANADAVFDSSLVYELSVLKTYAERYLLEVPPTHPEFTTAYRLRRLIDQFVAIYPDHVPPTSVIREFIGGSGFEY